MFSLGVVAFLLAVNTLRSVRKPTLLGLLAFFSGWLTADLPVYAVALEAGIAGGLIAAGGLDAPPGWVGLALLLASWGLLARAHQVAQGAVDTVDRVLDAAGIQEARDTWQSRRLLLPFPSPSAQGHFRVRGRRIRTIGGWTQRADVFAPSQPGQGRPVLVFAHGGGWVSSFRWFQGIPLMQRLAARGWVCVRVSYRLFPRGRFPDNLEDLKYALAWVRRHAHEWGGDPNRFFALHGNSAGGHLAALAALTANQPEYQPGFEDEDTSVDACALAYPPTDLRNRHRQWGVDFGWFIRIALVPQRRNHPDWGRASPIDQVHEGAPPCLVVHGEQDSLVPVGEGQRLVEELAKLGVPALFVPISGGQHALDVFWSLKGHVAVDATVRWLAHQRSVADQTRAKKPQKIHGN